VCVCVVTSEEGHRFDAKPPPLVFHNTPDARRTLQHATRYPQPPPTPHTLGLLFPYGDFFWAAPAAPRM
jgi:hypothetical protein